MHALTMKQLALENARQALVLLSNTNSVLPLDASVLQSVAVIGPNANGTQLMLGNYAVCFLNVVGLNA